MCTRVSFSNPTRSKTQEIVITKDAETNEILRYETLHDERNIELTHKEEKFKQSSRKIQVSYDLVDCHINICAPEVLGYFSDNFDYRTLQDDFLNNMLISEIIEEKLYMHEIQGKIHFNKLGYFAKVSDPRTYAAINNDVIKRYAHPIVVDSTLLCPSLRNNYSSFGIHQYKEDAVDVPLSTEIEGYAVIGRDTIIGNNTYIKNSTIGRDCKKSLLIPKALLDPM